MECNSIQFKSMTRFLNGVGVGFACDRGGRDDFLGRARDRERGRGVKKTYLGRFARRRKDPKGFLFLKEFKIIDNFFSKDLNDEVLKMALHISKF